MTETCNTEWVEIGYDPGKIKENKDKYTKYTHPFVNNRTRLYMAYWLDSVVKCCFKKPNYVKFIHYLMFVYLVILCL